MIFWLFTRWKKICKSCETGEMYYELDKNDAVCPYMPARDRKSCPFYVSKKNKNTNKKKEGIF